MLRLVDILLIASDLIFCPIIFLGVGTSSEKLLLEEAYRFSGRLLLALSRM